MIGTYLGEYAMTYNPTRHGRPGLGATKGAAKWLSIIFNSIYTILYAETNFLNTQQKIPLSF